MLNSKQRKYLTAQSNSIKPIYNIGKSSITPEMVKGIDEALEARELIKVAVLKNCFDDPKELGQIISERTHSDVVRVIGKKIILYRPSKNPVIELPQ
ncbi:MAG: ribosome assembly RNA-binding protein YhbY [Lachnospiraceae bacterium]|nr:ribosome assembly RNA-binding protein YhbY [Lachnospiraceae bacterium]